MLGKYLSDKIPWQQRRRLGIAVAVNTPTASYLTKIRKIKSAGCQLCRIAREARGKLKFVTLDKERNMSTLWRPEKFLKICSKDDLAEKAQETKVTIPVKKNQEARYNLDPESFLENRFWGRRPDGFAINETLKIGYILEFKRSTDRDEGFLEVKEAEVN